MSDNNTIDYDVIIQKALRNVIQDILKSVARHGMPGDHHFLITFATQFPGVKCPDYLAKENPDEITVILQHEYESLQVFEDCFKVVLGFDETDAELTIPFESILCFVDPHVKFGLHFDDPDSPTVWENDSTSDPNGKEKFENNVINLADFKKKKD